MFWSDRSIADMESCYLSYGIGSICNAKLNKAAGTNNLAPAIFFVKKVAIHSGHRLDSKPTTGERQLYSRETRCDAKRSAKATLVTCRFKMVGEAGIEPTTPGLEGRCSIQLSYSPVR
jgi:hypothetical protein